MSEYIINVEKLEIDRQKPIVRCKDCANAIELVDGRFDCHGYLVEVWDYYFDEPKQNIVEPNGFCAWGERDD